MDFSCFFTYRKQKFSVSSKPKAKVLPMRLWRSPVAHCSDKAGVPGSNPGSLISLKNRKMKTKEIRKLAGIEGSIIEEAVDDFIDGKDFGYLRTTEALEKLGSQCSPQVSEFYDGLAAQCLHIRR